jgi:hypothetical protein
MSRRTVIFRKYKRATPTETAQAIVAGIRPKSNSRGVPITREIKTEKAARIAATLHRTRI